MYKDLNDYELIYMIKENNIEEEVIIKKYETLENMWKIYIHIHSSFKS